MRMLVGDHFIVDRASHASDTLASLLFLSILPLVVCIKRSHTSAVTFSLVSMRTTSKVAFAVGPHLTQPGTIIYHCCYYLLSPCISSNYRMIYILDCTTAIFTVYLCLLWDHGFVEHLINSSALLYSSYFLFLFFLHDPPIPPISL
jgi:hypothetical protein